MSRVSQKVGEVNFKITIVAVLRIEKNNIIQKFFDEN